MQNSETTPSQPSILRNTAIVLYATLALSWLAIPQSVSNWSREYLPDFVQPVTEPITGTVEAIANVTRIPLLYEFARERFQSATKKN
jgi:hypothetical protein